VFEEADFELPKVILTALEILHIGLRLVNFTYECINRIAEDSTTNVGRFLKHYGVDHFVAAQMFCQAHGSLGVALKVHTSCS